MGKRKGILELAENFLEKRLIWFEDRLKKDSAKNKKKKIQKQKKQQLKKEVDYLREDLTKSEKKGIVSRYYKQGIVPTKSAERKRKFINEIEFKKRIKELEALKQKEQTKELIR